MKNHKRTEKILVKDLVFKSFMKSPIPMTITRAEDGTYVEVNESALKYMDLKRKDVIGRSGLELGYYSAEERQLIIEAIRKHGFARNMLLERDIPNQGIIQGLFGVYPVKMGRKEFFFSIAHAISNHQPTMKKFQDDKFYKITIIDNKYVKEILKPYHLTSRQQEVAILLAKGFPNREIAEKLFICENTVKAHMKEIFRIVGVHNRSELFPKLINLQ
ncbi:MAG: PAS and helix-turn-helix domain-containing protein [Smithella sp.]